jgi:hypothetical protein
MVNTRTVLAFVGLALVGIFMTGPVQPPATSPAPPPELAELLKLGEPSKQHRELDVFVGTWDQSVRCWVRPDALPIESTMTAEYAWALDGRYIEGRCNGTMFGRPFRSIELRGYDNASGCFSLQWLDNLGTTPLIAVGDFDPQSRVFSMAGENFACESRSKDGHKSPVSFRTATHLVGTDRMIFEIFSSLKDGREFRSLQVISARRGS